MAILPLGARSPLKYSRDTRSPRFLRRPHYFVLQRARSFFRRDDAQAKMVALKEKSDKDVAQHHMELKELMRIIDHDRKLKAFMGIKSEDRSDANEGMPTPRKSHEKDKAGDKDDTIEVIFRLIDHFFIYTNLEFVI